MADYRALDPEKIVATIERLESRIEERFPGSGLGRVCHELAATARTSSARAKAIEEPNVRLRVLFGIALALAIAGLIALALLAASIDFGRGLTSTNSVLQGIDAGFNICVLTVAALLGLARYEGRAKQSRALKDLHELRSLIHIIDMHQLTKNPSVVTAADPTTTSSPKRLTAYQLSRYLDYCAEMLSLATKIAALYAQSSHDAVVISTVNDLEQLAANLSEKIWQKIALVRMDAAPAVATPAPAAVAAKPSLPVG